MASIETTEICNQPVCCWFSCRRGQISGQPLAKQTHWPCSNERVNFYHLTFPKNLWPAGLLPRAPNRTWRREIGVLGARFSSHWPNFSLCHERWTDLLRAAAWGCEKRENQTLPSPGLVGLRESTFLYGSVESNLASSKIRFPLCQNCANKLCQPLTGPPQRRCLIFLSHCWHRSKRPGLHGNSSSWSGCLWRHVGLVKSFSSFTLFPRSIIGQRLREEYSGSSVN